jgi:uncharacterized protein DUF4386
MDSLAGASARRLARTAGALYLVNIVFGAFAIGLVPALLIKSDPAATAHDIQTHEMLYRLGLAAHVVVTAANIPLAVIFYDLFKVVNRRLALLDACFILVATAVEIAGILNQFTPLLLLTNGSDSDGIPAAQLQALAHLPGDLSPIDYSIYTVFYGCDIAIFSYLVLKSTFLPRALGLLLAIDGATYLADGFTNLLAPGVAAHLSPWTELPALFGEGSLTVWLLVVGLDVERWKSWAGAAIGARADRMQEPA